MMDELEDDIPDEFKGTLQITRDVSKSEDLGKTSPSNGSETSSVNDKILGSNVHDDSTVESPPKTLLTNITEKITPLVRRISTGTKNSLNGIKTVNHSAIALQAETATNYFTYRDGIIDKAVGDCISDIISEVDGALVGKYLLTEINLWDSDKERLILLMTNCVISVKYDFIALKILEYRRIFLKNLDNVVIGDLVYPPGSLVPRLSGFADGLTNMVHSCWTQTHINPYEAFKPRDRNARGVRLMWNRGEPLKFAVKWNPFNDDAPIFTLTSHPLYYHTECNDDDRLMFSFDEFLDKLRLIIGRENYDNVTIHHKSIVLQNYVGLSSLIHNRNTLGFFKVRGKFSF
ncbi:tumor protein p63-regulated gene 1-like protein isoform X1 [Atheta coriaria]|uniref:tumor protein p63-regulated gene 1-like protein isoform X1 n=1 Tax=Dalotia coriaria TaxID=877792 RepID=UPI0031F44916